MAYYRVIGRIEELYEEYIEAKNDSEAIDTAEKDNCVYFDSSETEEITKEEYEACK